MFARKVNPASGNATSVPASSSASIQSDDEHHSKRMRVHGPESIGPVQQKQEMMHEHGTDPEPMMIRAQHGPKFLQLNAEQRQQLVRMHNNLGHPDATVVGNVLKDQQWPPEAVEGIKDMHCSSCYERQRPRLARPSHLSEPRHFNDLIAMDAVKWTNA